MNGEDYAPIDEQEIDGLAAILEEELVDQINGMGSLGDLGDIGAVRKLYRRATKSKRYRTAVRKSAQKAYNRGRSSANASASTSKMNSRDIVLKYKSAFSDTIQAAIKAKKVKFVDHILYSAVATEGQQVVGVFTNSIDEKVGISNFNDSKMGSTQAMVVTHIRIDQAIIPEGKTLQETAFHKGELEAVLVNGSMKLEVDGKQVLDDKFPLLQFANDNRNDVALHTLKLDNPFVINPNHEVDCELKLADAPDEKSAIKVSLIGSLVRNK